MCGIVGAHLLGSAALPVLVEGLRTLEYRGYDSSGVGLVFDDGKVGMRKRVGRLAALEELVDGEDGLDAACVGIGHTRWATHGEPSDENAHPHSDGSGRLALVHNGIIENYLELKRELVAEGRAFGSDTDTEVLAHLVGRELESNPDVLDAVRAALRRVEGYYAMALVFVDADGNAEMVCARHGPPLCVGLSDAGAFLASDVLALLPHTRSVRYLEDGDVARLLPGSIEVVDPAGAPVVRPAREIDWKSEAADKGGFPHYMLKEIHEQPEVFARTLGSRLDVASGDVRLEDQAFSDGALSEVSRIQVVACGTALHAGYIARYLIEGLAGVPVDVDYASEFRYRKPLLAPGTLALAISQSGETADTLAALRLSAELGARTACICNVVGSTMVRECDAVLLTEAGPEIGVASTKAFLAQVVAATLFAVRLGRARGTLEVGRARELLDELASLPQKIEHLLDEAAVERVRRIAGRHVDAKGFLFLGRGVNYPVALEGALKLKEISYVHAEGYPAGEMKHGPIALIEPGMTIVVINSQGRVSDKVRANIEQVKARGGAVVALGSDADSLTLGDDALAVPASDEWLSPVLNVVPLQLFAYYVADLRGCDIDKPRNLAKSVTVE